MNLECPGCSERDPALRNLHWLSRPSFNELRQHLGDQGVTKEQMAGTLDWYRTMHDTYRGMRGESGDILSVTEAWRRSNEHANRVWAKKEVSNA